MMARVKLESHVSHAVRARWAVPVGASGRDALVRLRHEQVLQRHRQRGVGRADETVARPPRGRRAEGRRPCRVHRRERHPEPVGGGELWYEAMVADMGAAAGRIHFCGEHLATGARGLEGALETSERAVLEILSA